MKIQLTKTQLFLLLFVIQTGFVYTSFQNLVIEHSKRDASIQFLVVAVIFFLQLLFFERMYKYFVLNRVTKLLYLIYWFLYLIVFLHNQYTVFFISINRINHSLPLDNP